jgi:hypothetical protein
MKLTQINAIQVGEKYDLVLFGLDAEGQVYALHTHVGHLSEGKWVKVPMDLKKAPSF